MALLNLTDTERAHLAEMRALTTDKQGNEVMVGLTVEETQIVLAYGHARLHNLRNDRDDRARYLELWERHERHRLQIVGAEIQLRTDNPPRH